MTTAVNIESIEEKINELAQTRSDCLREANIVMEQAKARKEQLIAEANTAHGGIRELTAILDTLEGTDEAAADQEQTEEPAQDGGDDQHTG